MTFDVEAIKAAIIALGVGFLGSGLFYQLFKFSIKKLIEKLTGAVGELKNQRILTDEQHDKIITELISRETQLIDKAGEILDKLPEADAIARIDTFWQGVSERIELFLDEIERDDE